MQTIDLMGRWTLQQAGKSKRYAATVPGTVHADLLAAGAIADPYYRDNETAVQWVGETGWTFSRRFDVAGGLLRHDRVLLRCEGLDTLAEIRINGRKVARTDNMFRTWEFDVRRLLREGANTIDVHFDSVVPFINRRQKQRPNPSWSSAREIQGRSYVRKEPCNFGWDWGPVLITCGIWRPIRLVAFNVARLNDLQIRQDHSRKGQVTVHVNLGAEASAASPAAGLYAEIAVSLDGRIVARAETAVRRGKGRAALAVRQPKLWWPNGMGAQPLYQVTVALRKKDGAVLDTWTRRIGLRTLRLERKKDRWGESFQFAANGIPFFAKGANWVPPDAIYHRFTPDRYRRLLEDTAAANMNMLRVWGGGVYAEDLFYDLCDELGICVWQDFMFACSTYPAFDPAFLANVAGEADDNIRRLRHHACMALWCGNNELEQGLVGPTWNHHQMSWDDYGKLFDTLLPEAVRRLDPDRDYWPCSPHSPRGDRKDFNNPRCGDAHLWSVWHGRQPFEWYRTCEHRFNSEFGFQSFPEPKTTLAFTRPEDRNVTSPVMEHHQRSGIGNTVIMQYMLDWFRLPKNFGSLLWTSQILQGLAMKYAVEHWRRAMPRGMGTLYWQLNDSWPVASWASIDYPGRWKALHYAARNFYAPVLVSAVEDVKAKTVEVHVTSDELKKRRGRVRWTWTDLDGRVLERGAQAVTVQPRKNQRVATLDGAALFAKRGPDKLLLWVDLDVDNRCVSSSLAHFARPKHLELRDPKFDATICPLGSTKGTTRWFAVTVKARRPALWTWLELKQTDARWSDNFFHVRPGTAVTIEATLETPMTPAEFQRQLRIRSLQDTY